MDECAESTISSAKATTKIRTWTYSINLKMDYRKTFFSNTTRENVYTCIGTIKLFT